MIVGDKSSLLSHRIGFSDTKRLKISPAQIVISGSRIGGLAVINHPFRVRHSIGAYSARLEDAHETSNHMLNLLWP